MSAEIARHLGHRTVFRTTREVRCVDCDQTVLLPLSEPVAREPITPTDPNRCERHPGQHIDWCSGCAADLKAAQQAALPKQPTSSEQARQQAREALQTALRQRAVSRARDLPPTTDELLATWPEPPAAPTAPPTPTEETTA